MTKTIALSTGVTLEYGEHGLASGMPVVLLHGVTDSWRSFDPLFARLPATIRALALTQRGHGRSSKPAEGYTYTDLSEDVRAFMDALHLTEAVIVGHSMGSMVAQRFAVDHPGRVAGLVLLGAFRVGRLRQLCASGGSGGAPRCRPRRQADRLQRRRACVPPGGPDPRGARPRGVSLRASSSEATGDGECAWTR